MVFVLSLVFQVHQGFSETRVGWIELRNFQGETVQLEPEFYYAHIAIQIGNQWLHAHPQRGVEVVSRRKIEEFGKIKEVWASYDEDTSYVNKINFYLGRSFDNQFSWSDEKLYCAELVAKLLQIAPTPMHFDLDFWSQWYQQFEGKPGSSPSKIYRELKARDYFRVE